MVLRQRPLLLPTSVLLQVLHEHQLVFVESLVWLLLLALFLLSMALVQEAVLLQQLLEYEVPFVVSVASNLLDLDVYIRMISRFTLTFWFCMLPYTFQR